MATVDKNFKVKNGLIVGDSTNLVNYTSASPSDPFVGQLWVDSDEDSPVGDLSAYLTLVGASELYLPISSSGSLLTETEASAIYAPLASASLTGTVALPSSTSIGNVSATELGYLDGVTSAIQTQINTKASTGKAIAMAIVFGG